MAPIGPRAAVLAGTAVTAAALARRAKQKKMAPSELQSEPPPCPSLGEGAGPGPIAAGLRVVEMASIVAGPMVSRCLADWGAEVIKVEPPEGDLLRGMPPVSRDQKPLPRDIGSNFEFYNLGKAGVQLDFASSGDRAWLRGLLATADVFVTNVRVQALKKAGLAYSDLKASCPRLVFAHLTGWGAEGVDAERAGVDAGPYWTASGLAGALTGPETAGQYAIGFGDTITGMSLLGGVLCALLERDGVNGSGRGQFVEASLLRAGLWCAAPGILAAADVTADTLEGETVTDYSRKPPTNGSWGIGEEAWWAAPFPCGNHSGKKDFVWFDMGGAAPMAGQQLRQAVSKALHLTGSNAELLELPEAAFRERVAAALTSHDNASVAVAALHSEGVSSALRHVTFAETGTALFDEASSRVGQLYRVTGCVDELASGLGIKDFTGVPRIPVAFSESSAAHGPRGPGFQKGQHTRALLARSWEKPIAVEAQPSPAKPFEMPASSGNRSTAPLRGFTVVELSSAHDLSASATCCQLAEHGATVVKLQAWEPSLPRQLVEHYDRLKRVEHPQPDLASALDSYLSSADVLVTNLPESQLHARGVSLATIRSRFPDTTVVVLSPWGRSADAEAAAVAAGIGPECGALGALWVASGLSSAFMSVADVPPPTPLIQMPELCASAFGFAAVGAALLGKRRRKVASEIVDVSYLGVGLILGAFVQIMNRHTETRALAYDGWAASATDASRTTPFAVSKSSDGQLFMTYDLRLPTSLKLMCQVAGMSMFSLMGAFARGMGATATNPDVKKGLTGFIAARSLFRPVNRAFQERFEKLTWAEISRGLSRTGVWHNRVAMPYQMAGYPTACQGPAAGVSRTDLGLVVHSPVFLSRSGATDGRPVMLASKL